MYQIFFVYSLKCIENDFLCRNTTNKKMLKRIKFSKNGKYIIFKVKNKLFITSSKHSKKLQYKGYNCKICPSTLNVTGKSGGELTKDVWGDITNWFTDPKDFFKLFFSSKNIYENLLHMYNGCENILFKQNHKVLDTWGMQLSFIKNLRQIYIQSKRLQIILEKQIKTLSNCVNLTQFKYGEKGNPGIDDYIPKVLELLPQNVKKYTAYFIKNDHLKHLKHITNLEIAWYGGDYIKLKSLGDLENLKVLTLGKGLYPVHISNQFEKLTNLEELYLLPRFFSHLWFGLKHENFDIFKNVNKLTWLKVLQFKITMPFFLTEKETNLKLKLVNLKELELGPGIEHHPELLDNLNELEVLKLERAPLFHHDIPQRNSTIKTLSTVKRLWVNYKWVPSTEWENYIPFFKFEDFKRLTHLTITTFKRDIVDGDIKNLHFLKFLKIDLKSKFITDKGIKNLFLLKFLSLKKNKNIEGKGLKNLILLEFLNLERNVHIKSKHVIHLKNLRHCNLGETTGTDDLSEILNLETFSLEFSVSGKVVTKKLIENYFYS